MIPLFLPPVAPSPGGTRAPEVRLVESKFGDGYTQSRPDGLNHIRETVSLVWGGLTTSEMKLIRDFLLERGGHAPFTYQPHGYDAPVRWRCKDWSFENGPPWSGQARLEQDFGLAR